MTKNNKDNYLNINYNSSYRTYIKASKSITSDNNKASISLAILSSYTINQIEPIIKVELYKRNFISEIFMPGYNQFESEIFDSNSKLYAFNPDVIFFSIPLEFFISEIFIFQEHIELEKISEKVNARINRYIEKINISTNAICLFSNFLMPNYIIKNISDSQIKNGQIEAVYHINKNLKKISNKFQNFYVFDFFKTAYEFGSNNLFNNKMKFYADIPYHIEFQKYYSHVLTQYIKSILSPRKKCLVLDLDNTLWGGVIGEDSINGIKLGDGYPGNVYVEIQKVVKEISNTGIILAVNSKNNIEDVMHVFENHPNMILKKKISLSLGLIGKASIKILFI